MIKIRNYKKLIKWAKENYNSAIVVSVEELIKLRNDYDKENTLKINRLQLADLVNGNAVLDGVELVKGEWVK